MPTGHSLLTRVREQIAQAGRVSEHQVRDSILENLRAMCQTRIGSMLSCPEFGIASVCELSRAQEGASSLAESLRNTIKVFEPRLRNVRVQHLPSEDVILRFKITAQMVVDTKSSRPGPQVQFDTTVDPAHLISVQ